MAANVSMKLPIFWPDAAEIWFAQADAQFAIRSVTDSMTNFYHAVAVLPQEVALQILDLIRTLPAGDPYEVLRECLITLYTLYTRFEVLVSLPSLRSEAVSPNECPTSNVQIPYSVLTLLVTQEAW